MGTNGGCLNLRTSSFPALQGLYVLHDELGCGGFGQVYSATHLLTGQLVAVKIIDKRKIKDNDLVRIGLELDALRTLSHQNICQLYQYIDTTSRLYIIMEYCSGGELFDYVIKKNRLEESEARHFFRQLVQAMAYVHSNGIAHRDLKPENLLLTEDLQLKLIDFGLCARPKYGLDDTLSTCCGSQAYAAPELIQGLPYMGHQIDIWSMGVLLYTLLCGCLPFEGDSFQEINYRIVSGNYHEPEHLSSLCKDLLRSMMQVDPWKRITVPEIIVHPWVNKNYTQPLRWKSIHDKSVVDDEIIRELAIHFQKKCSEMEALVKKWKFDYLTATYYLLLFRKKLGMKVALPISKSEDGTDTPSQNILASQTIHASLDNDLNTSGLDQADLIYAQDAETTLEMMQSADKHSGVLLQTSVQDKGLNPWSFFPLKNLSYAFAMLNMSSSHTGSSPKHRDACGLNQESEFTRTQSIYVTPVRHQTGSQDNDSESHIKFITTPFSAVSAANIGSLSGKRKSPRTPVQITSHKSHGPRSSSKTPHFRQRVFASLERQADRMISLLTPRRLKNHQPVVLKHMKTMVNVSITSSKDPVLVMDGLIHIFVEEFVSVEQHGWKISGEKKENDRTLTVELEVVWIEMGNKEKLVGVKRRRLSGDSFLYKKVCEKILQFAGL